MATSGTTTFTLDLGDIMEEAYDLAGLEMRSGYDYRSAKRSLDLIFLEWQNKGLNLFTVVTGTQTLTEGQASYPLPADALEVIDVSWMCAEAIRRSNFGESLKELYDKPQKKNLLK